MHDETRLNDLNVIDRFLGAFIRYIDSGFGLLGPDVAFLTTTLVGIDITLAGLFWALGGEDDVIARFVKKILFVGAFAFILGNFARLADIIFRSFAGLGITAGGGTLSADDLLRPGAIAGTGFEAAWPLLNQATQLLGFSSFFQNFLTIVILLVAWLLVILSFFVLAIQLFVTILEFKLTSLAGFVLVPFALWNRTSFLAERVLGNVVASGIKLMVLAVIVGIGSGFFSEFTSSLGTAGPDLGQAMSLVLASLSLLGLGIFGPGIASGLLAGAPQLGAGSAVVTTVAAAGTIGLGGAAAVGSARAVGGGALAGLRGGTTLGAAALTSYRLGQETSGAPTIGAGLAGVARTAAHVARDRLAAIGGLSAAAERGRNVAFLAGARTTGSSASEVAAGVEPMPRWAEQLRSETAARHRHHVALSAIREGDHGGAGANPDIDEKED